jgi:hypothetical protein
MDAAARQRLLDHVRAYRDGLVVHDARAFPDVRHDGEEVTRLLLVLDDPAGDTWDRVPSLICDVT